MGGELIGPTEVGTGVVKEDKASLSEIIEILNDRFGTNFTEADRLFFVQVEAITKTRCVSAAPNANRSTSVS